MQSISNSSCEAVDVWNDWRAKEPSIAPEARHAQIVDRTLHDRAGVPPPPRVFAEIGPEQSRGDDVVGVRLHRQRRQSRLHERRVIVSEAALLIRRERIDDPGFLRTVAAQFDR
jgi:hypothetical protein